MNSYKHWSHINKSHAFKTEHKWTQWIIEFLYRTIHKKNLPFIDPFNFVLLAFWYKTLIFPTESGPKWLSSMFLITFPWEQMKVQLLLRLQVIALSTRCRTNLHPSTAWGDFIKANSFASASSISNSWSGLWNRIGSNWYAVLVYGKCCCVEPIGIIESAPRAADDTSINWSPSLTVNLDVQNFSWSERKVDYCMFLQGLMNESFFL